MKRLTLVTLICLAGFPQVAAGQTAQDADSAPVTYASLPEKIGVVFMVNGDQLAEMERTVPRMKNKGTGRALLSAIATAGVYMSRVKMVISMEGARAPLRTGSARPTFVMRCMPGFDPKSMHLVPFESRDNNRESVMAAAGGWLGLQVESEQGYPTVPTDAVPAKADPYVIYFTPAVDLVPGEYAWSATNSQEAFCFGVDRSSGVSATPIEAAVRSTANCRANFTVGGSMVRGTTYETYDEFPGVPYASALKAVESSIAKASLTIQSSEKTAGTITAAGQNTNGGDVTFNFTVVPASSAVRISIVQKLRAGKHGSDDAVRDSMCQILSSIAESSAKVNVAKTMIPTDNAPKSAIAAPPPPATAKQTARFKLSSGLKMERQGGDRGRRGETRWPRGIGGGFENRMHVS